MSERRSITITAADRTPDPSQSTLLNGTREPSTRSPFKKYKPFPFLLTVRNLTGYNETDSGVREPTWGNRLAVYHPSTSAFTQLSESGWRMLDKISPDSREQSSEAPGVGRRIVDKVTGPLTKRKLAKRSIIIPEGGVLETKIDTPSDRAEVYIQVTEACNANCFGCAAGMDQMKDAGLIPQTITTQELTASMTDAVASAANRGMKNVHFKWAGGEPTLPGNPWRRVREGQEIIGSLSEQYPNIDITQVIITNGTGLTDEVVNDIKTWNDNGADILVSVSLWGLEENQKMRGFRREKDKFPYIVDGIHRLHDAGILYNINHVLSPDNAKQYADFVRATWDPQSETFIGRDWKWPKGSPEPIPVSVSYFRPQTRAQAQALINGGYDAMVDGLRGGYEVMLDLVERGIEIPPVDSPDYLHLDGATPVVCGTGEFYFAIGPGGKKTRCHEGLYEDKGGSDTRVVIATEADLFDRVNKPFADNLPKLSAPNIVFPSDMDPAMAYTLGLHSGGGCPNVRLMEHGDMGFASSAADQLYAQIVPDILSLETKSRLKKPKSRLKTLLHKSINKS